MSQDDLLQKIGEMIKPLQEGQQEVVKRLDSLEGRTVSLETSVNQVKTMGEAVLAGQEAQATKADIHDLRVELTKRDKAYERRIENLEEKTDTPNPFKH